MLPVVKDFILRQYKSKYDLLISWNIFIWGDASLLRHIAIQKLSVFQLEPFSKAWDILQCKK